MPAEAPVLETKPTYGLAEPESYSYPKEHSMWTAANYDNFNVSKGIDAKDKSVSHKSHDHKDIKFNNKK